MRRLLALLAVVAAAHGYSSHLNADHVHDQDYPYAMGAAATPEAKRETAISSIELEVSADANDLRMNQLQGELDELAEEVEGLSSVSTNMKPQLYYMRYLRGELMFVFLCLVCSLRVTSSFFGCLGTRYVHLIRSFAIYLSI